MAESPMISIVTACFNAKDTIEDSIRSVLAQTYRNIEYIIIDGGSRDGALDIISRYQDKIARIISEPDKGIFDAFNKGIALANGDVVGILNADDVYAHREAIAKVAGVFTDYNVQSCYGDLLYVDRNNVDRVIRYWRSSDYAYNKLKYGWMPPHPTFFVKREIYQKFGSFRLDFKVSADYELVLRLLGKHKISTYYLPEILIKMRWGGNSNRNIKNLITKIAEDYRACRINNISSGFLTVLCKNLIKIPQFYNAPLRYE